MDVNVETLEPCRKKVAITIDVDQVREAFDKKYGELNDAVALPGFRPGRAPRQLLERRFSKQLAEEVKSDLIKEALESLVEDKQLEPLRAPDIDIEALEIEPDAPLAFEFEVVTKPEFETPEYKGLDVSVPPISVADEEIDQAVDGLRRGSATLESVEDGEVTEGDILIMDWRALEGESVEARDDGVYYPLGRGLLGGFVVESIDEALQGAKVGAQVEETVSVAADDAREDLRGRELKLEATLKQIQRYALPPIDADFLAKHDYDDEAEMRDEVSKRLERQKERGREREAERLLVAGLVDGIEISLPDEYVERELENWASRRRMQLQMEKVEEEDIAKQIDGDRADTKAAIERDMQGFFLLDRIADTEEIEATEAEMMRAIEEIAQAYGHPVEAVLSSFKDGGRLAELATEIRHRKARELIRREASLIDDPDAVDETTPKKTKKKAAKKKAAKKAAEDKDA